MALSLTQQDDKSHGSTKQPDLSAMTEDEQLHYALQMSLSAPPATTSTSTEKQTPDTEMKEVIFNPPLPPPTFLNLVELSSKILIKPNRRTKITQKL